MGKEIIKTLAEIVKSLLDVIYPSEEKCITCGIDGFIGVCNSCKSKIKRVVIQDNIFSYGYYGGVLKELILSFKYYKNFTAGNVLSDLLLELIDEEGILGDVICYVPMTKKSIKKRGFNQCELIAKNLSKALNIPISKCIKKVSETKEQKTLSKDERLKNVDGIFSLESKEELSGKTVILIDDVVTTGATLMECAKMLKANNVNKIIVLTIAKSNI